MNSIRIKLKDLKNELLWVFFISAGVFLFILFFQPLPLETLKTDNRLLYVAGFGIIEYLFSSCILILFPIINPKLFKASDWEKGVAVILYVALFIFTYTAFLFYIYYVGKTTLTIYILFKTALVCLIPIIILAIANKNESLQRRVSQLIALNKQYLKKINSLELQNGEIEIDIYSGNKAEVFTVKVNSLICINSADNYIEIYYLENGEVKSKLLRNTLKDIESQLLLYDGLIRSHRSCIVNTLFIKNLARLDNGYVLQIKDSDFTVPVSRQYLNSIRKRI